MEPTELTEVSELPAFLLPAAESKAAVLEATSPEFPLKGPARVPSLQAQPEAASPDLQAALLPAVEEARELEAPVASLCRAPSLLHSTQPCPKA